MHKLLHFTHFVAHSRHSRTWLMHKNCSGNYGCNYKSYFSPFSTATPPLSPPALPLARRLPQLLSLHLFCAVALGFRLTTSLRNGASKWLRDNGHRKAYAPMNAFAHSAPRSDRARNSEQPMDAAKVKWHSGPVGNYATSAINASKEKRSL